MSDSENKEPALCPKAKKRGKRSATSLAKRKKKYQEAQRGVSHKATTCTIERVGCCQGRTCCKETGAVTCYKEKEYTKSR